MEKHNFHALLLWLRNANAQFTPDCVQIRGGLYWLNSSSDIEELYQTYRKEVC